MSSSKYSYKYGTPNKQSSTENKPFYYSTNNEKSHIKATPTTNYKDYSSGDKYGPVLTIEQLRNQKLAWYQKKIEELRTYINSSSQIDRRILKKIFDWSDTVSEEESESNFLRELNIKVKKLINENQQLRQNVHSKDLQKLKHENAQLQKMIMEFQRGQTARQTLLDGENRYLRNYINQNTNNKLGSKEQINCINYQKEKQQVSLIDCNPLKSSVSDNKFDRVIQNQTNHAENITHIKKFFTNFINTVIESNDNKLEVQNKYIETLLKKVIHLEEQVKGNFNHFKFERKVRMQNSVRKSKNFSQVTPQIKGEQDVIQDMDQEDFNNVQSSSQLITRKLFVDRSDRVQQSKLEKQSLQTLKLRIRQLSEDYNYLQEKYAIQIQNHIKDTSDADDALMRVQKLQGEKKDLTQKTIQMTKELRICQQKIRKLQHGYIEKEKFDAFGSNPITSNPSNNIVIQLRQIREEIQSCSMNYSKEAEKQINKLVIERDSLQRQLIQIKKTTLQQSKNSPLQKQVLLLKEQNAQLQKNCRFYETQIEEYSVQLKELQQESEERLLKGAYRQNIQINEEEKLRGNELTGIQWQRKAHECMVNSVNRLIYLENQLKKESNLRS